MSNLSKRIQKAKQLRFTKVQNKKGTYNTWGSHDDHYVVRLKSNEKEVITPDGFLTIKVFTTDCKRQAYSPNYKTCNHISCKGNTAHTVCYHALGAIWNSFASIDYAVSFYNLYRDADRCLSLGGYIAKIVNQNGKGCVWAVIRKKGSTKQEKHYIMELPKSEILSSEENIKLIRGVEEDGID